MHATVADIVRSMESLAPPQLAENWDNVGLQVGKTDWPVKTVWVALDPGLGVISDAAHNKVDMLITHHPLIFKALTRIDFGTAVGSVIFTAIQNHIAIYSAHTNLDIVKNGINDVLLNRLGLLKPCALGCTNDSERCVNPPEGVGPGRIGVLNTKSRLIDYVREVKDRLKLRWIRFSGDPDLMIQKAAICSGSGASLMDDFLSSDADVFISGDLRYHDAREAESLGRGLIDIGHFASERIILDVLSERLRNDLSEKGIDAIVAGYRFETDPFTVFSDLQIN